MATILNTFKYIFYPVIALVALLDMYTTGESFKTCFNKLTNRKFEPDA